MREILLNQKKNNQGLVALVDDEDFERLNKVKWYAMKCGNRFYAVRSIGSAGTNIRMHRQILGLKKGVIADHKDGNGLNNQRSNLRIATPTQNCANRILVKGVSKYKGVTKSGKKWAAQIKNNGVHYWLGTFENEIDAALAYNKAAGNLFGEFANVNHIAT